MEKRMSGTGDRFVSGRPAVTVAFLSLAGLLPAEPVAILTRVDELLDQITVVSGQTPGDGFAGSLAKLGDLNGDGFEDIAFWAFSGGQDEESLGYILYGRKDLPRTVDLSQWSSWGIRLRSPYATRGSIPECGLGDIDGDGFGDVVFPACPPEVAGHDCPGYILFGGSDLPRDIDTTRFEGCRGCEVVPDSSVVLPGIWLLSSYAAGDLNGDGIQDLVFGASLSYPQGYPEKSGIVYVVFGRYPFPSAIDLAEVGRTIQGCKILSSYENFPSLTGVWLGFRVCAQKDFNGDGMADLAISAPRWDRDDGPGDEFGGAVFVVFGRREWPATLDVGLKQERNQYACSILSLSPWLHFGQAVLEGVNDVTGDGLPDLLVAAYRETHLFSGQNLPMGTYLLGDLQTTSFVGEEGIQFYGTEIGNWDGEGPNDFAFRSPPSHIPASGTRNSGAVYLLPGRSEYPAWVIAEMNPEGLAIITGATPHARFGEEAVAADLNGDGRKDLVVSAPGAWIGGSWGGDEPPTDPGKLYIIPHGTRLLGPLECGKFGPNTSDLGAGGRLFITGKGLDGRAEVHVGGTRAEILSRPNSRTLIARIPAADAPGSASVRILQGDQGCLFQDSLLYYESLFPREVDVLDLGSRGCTIFDPRHDQPGSGIRYILESADHLHEGGEDITGDGLGDILVKHKSDQDPSYPQTCKVYLFHGDHNLPREILLSGDISGWATTFLTNEDNECGDELFGYSAHLVGDMNGDGASELAIAALVSRRMYIILGGALPKGPVNVHDLLQEGRCIVVENCPYRVISYPGYVEFYGVKVGDVNGDGLSDLAIVGEYDSDPQGNMRSCLAFVLGSRQLPPSLSYLQCPRLYGRFREESDFSTFTARGVGDADGDGCDDIVFFSYELSDFETGHPVETVEIAIFFGRRFFAPETTYEEEIASGGACRFLQWLDAVPCDVGPIGDQNGDGKDDIGVTSVSQTSKPVPETGRFRVIYGGSRERLCWLRNPGRDSDFDVTFRATRDYNGLLGDINGGRDFNWDGKPDILLCDVHGDYFGAPPPGRAFVIFGGDLEKKAGPLSELTDCLQLVNYLPEKVEVNWFPYALEFARDVNADGYEDLVVYDRIRACVYFNPLGSIRPRYPFIRGDSNQDGRADIGDAIAILQYLFLQGNRLMCMDAADANDDEGVNIADPVALLMWLFVHGPPPPPPTECGPDPAGEKLDCAFSICL